MDTTGRRPPGYVLFVVAIPALTALCRIDKNRIPKCSISCVYLDTGGTLTHAQLVALISDGDVMSVMGVYPGTGTAAVGTLLQ